MWNRMLAGLMAVGLAACTINPPGSEQEASVIPEAPESLEENIARHRFEVIEEVDRIPFAGTINSWGYFDNKAIWVETGPNRYYMLTLSFPCHDLRFAESIGIKTRLPQVYRNDQILIPDRNTANCRIDKIYTMQKLAKDDNEGDEGENPEPGLL